MVQVGIKPAVFLTATLYFFLLIHTFLIFSPVGLTMKPFPGDVARDTRSFPAVPSPVSSVFERLSYRQHKENRSLAHPVRQQTRLDATAHGLA